MLKTLSSLSHSFGSQTASLDINGVAAPAGCFSDRNFLTLRPRLWYPDRFGPAGRSASSCSQIWLLTIAAAHTLSMLALDVRRIDHHSLAEKIRNVTKVKSLLSGERALQCCLC